MPYLTLLTALSISGVAAWYSIVGLAAIFSAAVLPIIIMGSVLEVGKLVTASWLYQNWNRVPFLLKTYLTTAVIVLMFITSMGIFGFLSKAHIEQGLGNNESTIKAAQIETRIQRENREIERNEAILAQLDDALQRYIELGAVTKGLAARESQTEEREKVQESINQASETIIELQDELAQIELQVSAFKAEVGPLAYVAELLYGEDSDEVIESAVRAVILVIVFVFDPLAVLLIIAANMSLKDRREKIVTKKVAVVTDDDWQEEEKQIDGIAEKEEPSSDPTGTTIEDDVRGEQINGDDSEDQERLPDEQNVDTITNKETLKKMLETVDERLTDIYNNRNSVNNKPEKRELQRLRVKLINRLNELR
jgi:hypothetical protein